MHFAKLHKLPVFPMMILFLRYRLSVLEVTSTSILRLAASCADFFRVRQKESVIQESLRRWLDHSIWHEHERVPWITRPFFRSEPKLNETGWDKLIDPGLRTSPSQFRHSKIDVKRKHKLPRGKNILAQSKKIGNCNSFDFIIEFAQFRCFIYTLSRTIFSTDRIIKAHDQFHKGNTKEQIGMFWCSVAT